jgi:hypothetical protein
MPHPCTVGLWFRYVMFYEGVGPDQSRSIGVAVSKDGMNNWKRCPTPVLQPASNGWDQGSVGSPCAVAMAGMVLYPRLSSLYK